MNAEILEQKLKNAAGYGYADPAVAAAISRILPGLDDWRLRRINPLRFSEEHGLAAPAAVDAFVSAARAGVFDLSWSLVCPSCGSILYSYDTIDRIQGDSFFCSICGVDIPVNMDDYTEVSFSVNPDVHSVRLDPFSDADAYRRYFFSDNFMPSERFTEYMKDKFLSFGRLDGRGELVMEKQIDRGVNYRLLSITLHSSALLPVAGEESAGVQDAAFAVTDAGFRPGSVGLRPGRARIRIANRTPETVGVAFVSSELSEIHRIIREDPPSLRPFLTGKMLLNNQAFRELFRIQNLSRNLKLNVRSLTLLFTDLKGSTELYDSIGDITAYGLIQEHFNVLGDSVRRHSGAIIKTMGDAIMATFSEPGDGLLSAMDMMERIKGVRSGGGGLGLKVGIHEGPALAINNDGRLDYFGQTVNIAARVQGLAQAGEIWITDSMMRSRRVKDILDGRGFCYDNHSVSLKGIGQAASVYKCTPR